MSIETTLEKVEGSLQSASGNDLIILGRAPITLCLGTLEFTHQVVVVENLDHPCLLGGDFFSDQGCVIRYDNRTLEVAGQEIPLHSHLEKPRISRVILPSTVTIPPNSEMIVAGQLRVSQKINDGTPGMIERHLGQRTIHTGRTLVIPKDGKVPVRLANFSDSPVKLKNNETLGWFHPSCREDAKVFPFLSSEGKGINSCTAPPAGEPAGGDTIPPKVGMRHSASDPLLGEDCEALFSKLQLDSTDLNPEQLETVKQLIIKYKDIFSKDDFDIGRSTLVTHNIDTGDAVPIKQAPRRLPPHRQKLVEDMTDELLARDLIQESQSPWSAPIVLARKHDGSMRLCIDYRLLNSKTVKSAQPLPRVDDTLDRLSGSRWFSCLDCASGYWQMEVAPEDRSKTSFVFANKQYEWKVMPFGLTGAPASFTRLMNLVLGGLTYCLVYLDDVIVHAPTFEQHLASLTEVFERIRQSGLKLKPSKCHLFQSAVKFLGHVVSENGVACDPEKTQKIADWPVPQNLSDVRSFLGLATYYQRFVPDFSTIAAPLHHLTKKEVPFVWTQQCETAFNTLKSLLMTPPVLAYPDFSEGAGRFILDTDASDFAIGAVLSQEQSDGVERVIGYGSRSLHNGEENYCTTRREMLAVVYFAEHFKYYLLGKKFLCRTDHMALRWLLNFKEPSGQVARWMERLAEFDFDVEHRPGRLHGNADAMSRRPKRVKQHGDCPTCGPTDKVSSQEVPVPAHSHQVSSISQSKPTVDESCAVVGRSKGSKPRDLLPLSVSSRQGLPRGSRGPLPENQPRKSSKKRVRKIKVEPCPLTPAEIAKAQQEDQDIRPVLSQVKAGEPPSEALLQGQSSTSRAIFAQFSLLSIQDDCLVLKSPKPQYKEQSRYVLPKKLGDPVLAHLHDGFAGAHLGQMKTEFKLRRRFWRPGLKRLVREYVQSCLTCQKCKSGGKATKAPLISIPVGRRNQRIHIDIIGEITPPSKRGHRYILVLQDAFTKWPEAWVLRNARATTCATVIINDYISRFGVPENLHSDRGSNFESEVFAEVCRLLHIHKSRTTAYHPQCNGQVENLNGTLKRMLTTMVDEEGRDWDHHIHSCLMAYRSSVQASTKETPYSMTFGEEMSLPLDLVLGSPPSEPKEQNHYVSDLRERIESSYHKVRENLQLAQRRQREYYDRNMKSGSFKVGDLVLLKNHAIKPGEVRKFHKKWRGPYLVLEKLSEVNYRVEPVEGVRRKKMVVHLNNMKTYYTRENSESHTATTRPAKPRQPKVTPPSKDTIDQDDSSDSDEEMPVVLPLDVDVPTPPAGEPAGGDTIPPMAGMRHSASDPLLGEDSSAPRDEESVLDHVDDPANEGSVSDDTGSQDDQSDSGPSVEELVEGDTAPPQEGMRDSASTPTLSADEEEDSSEAEVSDEESYHQNPHNLRPRNNLRPPARYCDSVRRVTDAPDTWQRIRAMRHIWLKRGYELKSKLRQ